METQTNPKLQLAFDFVQYTNKNIFLTGKAGTGKTTFLRNLKMKSPKRMIVVAPTGVAAINAGGVTIHSFFQLSFGLQILSANEENSQHKFSKEKINIIRSLDLLVIDEISMVRADLLDAIDRVLRRYKNKYKAFGGVQLLMIGDLQQLAPIVKEEEWELLKNYYETMYFFSSNSLKEVSFVAIELTHVFRQSDIHFINILNKVRDNKLDSSSLAELNKRFIPNFLSKKEEGYITLTTHNYQSQRINESELQKLPSKSHKFTAKVEGNFPEYSYPTDFELSLKEEAQVMFVKNDSSREKLFYNGKIGKIAKIDDDVIYVQCPNEQDEIAVSHVKWDNTKYVIDPLTSEIKEHIDGVFIQYPLKLAWAITIHKSQGLTFEKAIIDAESSFAHGQVYVALSRCKTLEGMVLSSPISMRSIINDSTVGGFTQQVEQNQPTQKELDEAHLTYQKELAEDAFSFKRIFNVLKTTNRYFEDNSSSIPKLIVDYFQKLQLEISSEIVAIAEKFTLQMNQYIMQNPNIEQNVLLQERIPKAATYFLDKTQTLIIDSVGKVDLDVDNKEIAKQIKESVKKLNEETNLKIALLTSLQKGFNVKDLLTARAIAFIEKDKPKEARKNKDSTNLENVLHPELYKTLKYWRQEKASNLNWIVYMVLSQKALIEIVEKLPMTKADLKKIKGVGSKKVLMFGDEILSMVDDFCKDNGIDKEIKFQDEKEIPIKPKKPKVDSKLISFELYKSGKTIFEIAQERNFAPSTIEGHLAEFIETGEFDIHDFVSEDKIEQISNYFKNAETLNLTHAKKSLGEDFSYSELIYVLKYLVFKGEIIKT